MGLAGAVGTSGENALLEYIVLFARDDQTINVLEPQLSRVID